MTSSQPAAPAPRREVSPLELFFDLVFVFAVSQLSHHLLTHLSWRGALEMLVMMCAVFTVWLHVAFEATFLDITRRATQVMVLSGMALALFMNAGISSAFEAHPALFAVPLVLIQLGRPLVTSRLTDVRVLAVHFRAMLAWMACSAPLWLAGVVVGHQARLWLWLVAAAIDVVGSLTAHPVPWRHRQTDAIPFDGAHLQERLQLFLIIVLGEVVLTTGTAVADAEPRARTLVAGAAGFVAVASLWALYFAGSADIVDDMVEHSEDAVTASRIAGGVEYLVVAGLVMVAVGSEVVAHHPAGHGSLTLGLLLFGGSLLYVLAQALFLRFTRVGASRVRIMGALVMLPGIVAAPLLPPLVCLLSLDLVLVVLAALLTRERRARAQARGATVPRR